MAFTVNDLQDLLKLLREHPEWREEVRREVLGDELLTLPDLVRQNSEDIRALAEIVGQNSADIRDLQAAVRELKEVVNQVSINLLALGNTVSKLVTEVSYLSTTTGGHMGELLELWYERHPGVLAQIRKFRKVSVPTLASLELVDRAYESGTLPQEQLDSLYQADLLISGREGQGDEAHDALLVVEVSNTIDRSDLNRAATRAAILRSVGYIAYAVVAGRRIDERTRAEAEDRGIAVHLRISEQLSA